MPVQKVWSRFETKKKDGTVLKLRTQDLPSTCIDEVTELMLQYYVSEEPCQKAIGVGRCSETRESYSDYMKESLSDPNFSCVICCPDDGDEVTQIIGVSAMIFTKEYSWDLKKEGHKPKEWEIYNDICERLLYYYNPMKEFGLSSFYDDRGLLVVPEFRGLGIAEQLLKSRRIICAAQDVPMTGAWMSAFGTQVAAERDGWETVSVLRYSDLANKYGLDVSDAPRTMKYMIASATINEEK